MTLISSWDEVHLMGCGFHVYFAVFSERYEMMFISSWDEVHIIMRWGSYHHEMRFISSWDEVHIIMRWCSSHHEVMLISSWGDAHIIMRWGSYHHEVRFIYPWIGGSILGLILVSILGVGSSFFNFLFASRDESRLIRDECLNTRQLMRF